MKKIFQITSHFWLRCLVALLIVGLASAVRALWFGDLGRGIPYLTYYPAVMLAGLYGGLSSGLLATAVSGYFCFFWIQRGFMSPVETLAIVVFFGSCSLISSICEAMHRANARAKLAQAKAEASIRELQSETAERVRAAAALQVSHQQVDGILSSLYAGVLSVSKAGFVEHANQAFCDLFHLAEPPHTLRGMASTEMLRRIRAAYATPGETLARIQNVVAQGKALRGEEVTMRDGHCLLVDFIPLELAGQRCGHIWHHQDITARKRAEEQERQLQAVTKEQHEALLRVVEAQKAAEAVNEHLLIEAEASRRTLLSVIEDQKLSELALQASEQAHRRLIRNLHAGVVVHGPDTQITLANNQAATLLGLTTDQMFGKTAIDPEWRFLKEDETPLPLSEYPVNQVLATRAPLRDFVAGVNRPRSGDLVWVIVNAFPEFDEKKELRQIVVTFSDITSRKLADAKLRHLQHLLNEAEALGNVGGWEFDIATGQQVWTEGIYRIHEVDRSFDPSVTTGIKFYTPAAQPVIERAVQRAVTLGEPFDLELQIITAKGNLRDVHAVGRADLTSRKVHGYFQDITDWKRADLALRASEAKYRRLYESLMDGFCIVDMAGHLQDFNRAYQTMLGYSDEEIRHATYVDVTPEKWHAGEARIVAEQVLPRGYSDIYEKEYRRKDGTVFPIELRTFLLRGTDGQPAGMWAIIRDITTRKQAEQEIRQLNADLEKRVAERTAELSDMYNNAPCGYHSLDRDGRFVRINDTELKWLGYTREEIEGKKRALDLFTPASLRTFQQNFPVFLASGRLDNIELEMVRRDGSILSVLLSATSLKDPQGNFVMSRSTMIDYTDRKRAEAALRQTKADLEAANRELEAFSYSVSHDLRAPLRTLDGFSRILLEDYAASLDEEGREHLSRIRAGAQRMGHLIDDLLNLARVSRHELDREPVDLSAMANMVIATLQQGEPARPVQVVVAGGLTAIGDPRLLRIMLENLLGNAWKFTGKCKAARIEFGAGPNPQLPVLNAPPAFFIRDNGAGFDEAHATKLFGAFQRLHSSAEFPGTGIGLATVQRIVRRHGGRVWAEGQVGTGATFYFTLARHDGAKNPGANTDR